MRLSTYKVATLILLSALSKAEMPEDDFRIINRQDLLESDRDIFEDKDSKSFSQLLFDVARDQVLVGARDAIYRLSLRGLRMLERADWPAPADKVQLCQDKGQTEEDCHNYIKVLLSYGHKLFACGTNAFSPICTWREIESIGQVLEQVSGIGNCPYNPRSNVTALLAGTGEYFTGTPTDFASSYTAIGRSRGASVRDLGTLRSAPYDQNWLNEPQFVGSFEDDHFVYFVFREIAVEFMNCGKIIYSRLARVCKNDSGGHPVMKDNWSTFLKARLNCSVPGDYPFYYDEVQGIEYLPNEKILVATFTTPTNSIAGSAVCMYSMSEINAAFDGPYKVQGSVTRTWEPSAPSPQARDHFRCLPSRDQSTDYLPRYHLMHESVKPMTGRPVYASTLQRFTHVTSDVTFAKPAGKQHVLFVSTLENEVLKLAVLPRFEGACLVELWRLKDEKGTFNIHTMQFVKDTMSVYLGTDEGVLRLSAHRCARYRGRGVCVRAGDPYCGWDDARELCVDASAHIYQPHFVQASDTCARIDTPVDGGWSSWSEPEPCVQDNGAPHTTYGDEKPDMCMCRTRQCNNPRPANGGLNCQGASISVSNCTVHGGWSAWGAWSECSTSCGIAIKSRRRLCASPEPKYGGRVCVGPDQHEVYCTNLPPCPDPALAPVDGGWSSWGPWGPCAGEGGPNCGPSSGWKERRRTCTDPTPKNGGADCEGTKVERQVCDLRPCEVKKATAWTPWVQIPNNSSDGSYTEKRFKFLCKAPSPEQIKLSIAKEEDRFCSSRGTCSSTPPEDDADWDPWGPWGQCSASCGGGQQTRTRRCRRNGCRGPSDMLRACNMHACTGEWSCWSEWSECSGSCASGGAGHRSRTRLCLSPEGCADAGQASERRICLNNCAVDAEAGWGSWSAWSGCVGGERVRTRECERGACAGPLMQVTLCNGDDVDDDNELSPMPAYSQNVEMASFVTMARSDSMSVGGIVACVGAAFAMGCLACLAAVIYCSRRPGSRLPWRHHARVPSSPHYITAKQNSYVTVPLKEVPRKAKRQPSFTGIGGGSGIILSKSNNISNANNHNNTMATPKLYPKAIANEYDSMGTLRRHSNLPNNRNNLDLEEEKFY